MGAIKMPEPLWNDVLIHNPMKDEKANEEIEKKAKKLPQAERDEFYRKHMASLWENVEILAVGEEVRKLKVGDRVIGTPEAVTTAMPTPDGNFLFVSERAFKARW
jgi:hypothetical protein